MKRIILQRAGTERPLRFWQTLRCAGVLVVLMGVPGLPGSAHELADGELERWCEIVVRDELIQVRYSIGFNARTAAMVSKECGIDSGAPLPVVEDDAGAVEQTEPPGPDADRETWKDALARYVTQHVQLQVDETTLTPIRSEVIPSGRHPMCWFVAMEFAAPRELTSFQLIVADSAFPKFPGPARQAIRSKSRWELSESSAAPLLVRAKAEAWTAESPSSPASRPGARIEARLAHTQR